MPDELIEKVVKYQFSLDEIISLFKDLIDESRANEKALLHVAFINELKRLGELDLMKDEIQLVLDTYDNNENKAFWYTEFLRVTPDAKALDVGVTP